MTQFHNPWDDDGENSKKNSGNTNSQFEIPDIFAIFNKGGGNGRNYLGIGLLLVALVIGVFWMLSGFYVVNPNEKGVETVFGRYVGESDPGLRYNYPRPIGQSIKIQVTNVNKEVIGYREVQGFGYGSRNASLGADVNAEVLMLTGDENMVDINFEVQWRINNPYNYLFHVRDVGQGMTVRSAAESAMREIVGQNSINFALDGNGRAQIASMVQNLLQKILDTYDMGISVLSVQLKKVDPPEKVVASFRDVQSARADKEREINQAFAYKNDILPKARGEAVRVMQDAEAYKQEVINAARGEVDRFVSVFKQYQINPEVTRKRMYLETMEDVLKSSEKVVLDKKIDGSLLPHFAVKSK